MILYCWVSNYEATLFYYIILSKVIIGYKKLGGPTNCRLLLALQLDKLLINVNRIGGANGEERGSAILQNTQAHNTQHITHNTTDNNTTPQHTKY